MFDDQNLEHNENLDREEIIPVEAEPVTDEPQQQTPPYQPYYTNTIAHTKKEKKGTSPWVASIVSCVVTAAVLTGAFTLVVLPASRQEILNQVQQEQPAGDVTTNIPAVSLSSAGDNSVADIAESVGPSVVSIINKVIPRSGLNISVEQGSGSGIVISEDGYIVTNNHVIAGANELTVRLSNDETYSAKVIGTDEQTDLAVIKIDASGLKYAALGNSNDLRVGEQVIAIGNPLGQQFAGTVTVGYVSAVNRKLEVEGTTYNLIQTDAAINSGNSGGALVNTKGEVIGINSVKVQASGVEGLGFAIPISDAKPIIDDLMLNGYVTGRPSIGVEIVALNNSIAYYYDLPLNYGLYINSVQAFSGAEKAGLRGGDIIIKCDGETVRSVDDLNSLRDTHRAGDTITLTIYRDEKELDVRVELSEAKPDKAE